MGGKIKNLAGKTFGRLLVLSFHHRERRRAYWLCRCSCEQGTELIVRADSLSGKRHNTQSCGCQKVDSATRHGHNPSQGTPSPTYITWQSMIQRCTDPGYHSYWRYGGTGISVCERWRDFRNFLADMGERPKGTTIDRFPDRQGNYEPGNARWATPKQQAQNRCTNRLLTYNGQTRSVSEWAELQGIPRTVIQDRLRLRWSDSDAITTPYTPRIKRQYR